MEKYRSQSCKDGKMMQIENGEGFPSSMKDLRSYSTAHAHQNQKMEKAKVSNVGGGSGSGSKNWSFSDPELQRKKRVAGYKVYAVEGKMKGSFRKSFRWIKDTYTQVFYGFR